MKNFKIKPANRDSIDQFNPIIESGVTTGDVVSIDELVFLSPKTKDGEKILEENEKDIDETGQQTIIEIKKSLQLKKEKLIRDLNNPEMYPAFLKDKNRYVMIKAPGYKKDNILEKYSIVQGEKHYNDEYHTNIDHNVYKSVIQNNLITNEHFLLMILKKIKEKESLNKKNNFVQDFNELVAEIYEEISEDLSNYLTIMYNNINQLRSLEIRIKNKNIVPDNKYTLQLKLFKQLVQNFQPLFKTFDKLRFYDMIDIYDALNDIKNQLKSNVSDKYFNIRHEVKLEAQTIGMEKYKLDVLSKQCNILLQKINSDMNLEEIIFSFISKDLNIHVVDLKDFISINNDFISFIQEEIKKSLLSTLENITRMINEIAAYTFADEWNINIDSNDIYHYYKNEFDSININSIIKEAIYSYQKNIIHISENNLDIKKDIQSLKYLNKKIFLEIGEMLDKVKNLTIEDIKNNPNNIILLLNVIDLYKFSTSNSTDFGSSFNFLDLESNIPNYTLLKIQNFIEHLSNPKKRIKFDIDKLENISELKHIFSLLKLDKNEPFKESNIKHMSDKEFVNYLKKNIFISGYIDSNPIYSDVNFKTFSDMKKLDSIIQKKDKNIRTINKIINKNIKNLSQIRLYQDKVKKNLLFELDSPLNKYIIPEIYIKDISWIYEKNIRNIIFKYIEDNSYRYYSLINIENFDGDKYFIINKVSFIEDTIDFIVNYVPFTMEEFAKHPKYHFSSTTNLRHDLYPGFDFHGIIFFKSEGYPAELLEKIYQLGPDINAFHRIVAEYDGDSIVNDKFNSQNPRFVEYISNMIEKKSYELSSIDDEINYQLNHKLNSIRRTSEQYPHIHNVFFGFLENEDLSFEDYYLSYNNPTDRLALVNEIINNIHLTGQKIRLISNSYTYSDSFIFSIEDLLNQYGYSKDEIFELVSRYKGVNISSLDELVYIPYTKNISYSSKEIYKKIDETRDFLNFELKKLGQLEPIEISSKERIGISFEKIESAKKRSINKRKIYSKDDLLIDKEKINSFIVSMYDLEEFDTIKSPMEIDIVNSLPKYLSDEEIENFLNSYELDLEETQNRLDILFDTENYFLISLIWKNSQPCLKFYYPDYKILLESKILDEGNHELLQDYNYLTIEENKYLVKAKQKSLDLISVYLFLHYVYYQRDIKDMPFLKPLANQVRGIHDDKYYATIVDSKKENIEFKKSSIGLNKLTNIPSVSNSIEDESSNIVINGSFLANRENLFSISDSSTSSLLSIYKDNEYYEKIFNLLLTNIYEDDELKSIYGNLTIEDKIKGFFGSSIHNEKLMHNLRTFLSKKFPELMKETTMESDYGIFK